MAGPLGFTPRHRCYFLYRFDDPRQVFRTLYSAAKRLTCLREVLSPLDQEQKAVQEFATFSGVGPPAALPRTWRERRVLAPARVRVLAPAEGDLGGKIVQVETDEGVRSRLERELRPALHAFGLTRLDSAVIRGPNRDLTQKVARALFSWGAAGLVYGSRLDGEPCLALFETRAFLEPAGAPIPLTGPVEELLQVCREFGLSLTPAECAP